MNNYIEVSVYSLQPIFEVVGENPERARQIEKLLKRDREKISEYIYSHVTSKFKIISMRFQIPVVFVENEPRIRLG